MGQTYNGAISVLPCDYINIPQPGVLLKVAITKRAGNPEAGYTPANEEESLGPKIIIVTNGNEDFIEAYESQNISGGDVMYVKSPTSLEGELFPLQVESIEFGYKSGVLNKITILCDDNFCASKTKPEGPVEVEFYRGNWAATNGLDAGFRGYTGAGNSEGYSLLSQDQPKILPILTVNNDYVSEFPTATGDLGSTLDLRVVKVFCTSEDDCLEQPTANYPSSKILALKIE